MVNDPAPIRDLAERLDDLTVAVAKAPELRRPAREPPRRPGSSTPATFDELKAATDTPERRDDLHRQIAAAFAPADPRRRARPRHPAPQRGVEPDPVGPPRRPEPAPRPTSVPRERVVPERIAKPDGPVCQEFVAAFTSPRLGPILFRLVAEQARRHARRSPTTSRPPPSRARRPGAGVADDLRHLPPRRRPRRAGPGDRRGAAHPAPAGARDGQRRSSASAPGSGGPARSSSWSPRCSP